MISRILCISLVTQSQKNGPTQPFGDYVAPFTSMGSGRARDLYTTYCAIWKSTLRASVTRLDASRISRTRLPCSS